MVTINIARACQGCIAEAICTFFPEAKPVGFYYGGGIEGEECPESHCMRKSRTRQIQP